MGIVSPTGLIVLLGIAIAYAIHRLSRKSHERPLPPGPKGLPLLGNVNDLPKPGVLECHHWLEHKDLYGPISSITVLGQTFVIINDAQIALELLRDRSAIHSARPHMVFASDMYVRLRSHMARSLTVHLGSGGKTPLLSAVTRTRSNTTGRISPKSPEVALLSRSSTACRRRNRSTSF